MQATGVPPVPDPSSFGMSVFKDIEQLRASIKAVKIYNHRVESFFASSPAAQFAKTLPGAKSGTLVAAIWAELGDAPFTAMNALTVKATEGEAVRDQIIKQAIETLGSPRQDFLKRWQCCYVLSGLRDPRGIPPTARALKDPNTILRDVAACALGQYDHPDARSALHAAARTERDPKVRETIAKALQ